MQLEQPLMQAQNKGWLHWGFVQQSSAYVDTPLGGIICDANDY